MSVFPHRRASHIGERTGILWAVGFLIGACLDAGAANPLSPGKAWSIAERGPHHTRWESVAEFEIEGARETVTQSYTELRSGMHYWDELQSRWLEAKDDIEWINGIGVARQSGIQVVFSPDLADPQGNIEIWLPDGKHFRTQLTGVALTDPRSGQSVWVAKPRSSQAHLIGRNKMLYADAFEGLRVDVQYTHSEASFEQDIVLKEQPPSPADFGMDEESTRLEVWTEFFTASEPALHSSHFQRSPEEVEDDQTIDFGSVSLIPGKAFRTQSESLILPSESRVSEALPVSKSWIRVGNRKFLIESLPLRSMRRALDDLPRPQASFPHFLPVDSEGAMVLSTPTRQMPQTPPLTFSAPSVLHDQVARVDFLPIAPVGAGFLIDYIAVTTTSDFTFKADSTYLISGTVNLSGTNNLFEGGAVVKYTASPASTLRILGHAQFQSSPYRPVFFTAKDDNTIGETISGSTGDPTLAYYGDPAIAVEGANAVFLKHARFLHTRNGVTLGFSSPDAHSISHVHFLRCESAIRPYQSFRIGNALFSNLSVAFEGNSSYPVTITAEHLTLSSINALSMGSAQSVVSLVNCILVNVPNWGSVIPLQYSCYTATSVSAAFQSVGGGAFYLKDDSPYRNLGTTAIDPTLASDLESRTTYAPTLLSIPLTADTLLSVRVQRDTDIPDIGYHYEPLDYLIPEILISNAVVTLTNGVAIGTTSAFGFSLANGAVLDSRGTALKPNRVVRFRNAQESPITGGDSMSANIRFVSNSSPPPSLKALFTDFSVLPGLGYNGHLQGTPNGSMHTALSHCALHGGRINLQNWTGFPFASTNTLYERVYTLFQATSFSHFNNLHRGGTLKFYIPSTAPWTAKDNLFDNTSLFNGSSPTLDLSHNAYITNANRFSPEGPNNVTLPASPSYQSTVLGSFYLPPNSGLADRGSRTAASAGLYHFTTLSAALSKEASSQVDIGLHYPAITASGDLTDSDGDGLFDIFEDVNGDGSASGEVFNWQSADTDGDGLGDLLEYELSTNLQVNDPAQDFANEQNTQFEPHLTLLNGRVIVSFVDSNQGEYGLGGISDLTNHIPQFVSYSLLQPGSSTFQDMGHPPLSTMGTPTDTSDDGDGGDPVLAVDPTLGNMGTVYMVGTSMRSTNGWKGFPLWKSTDGGLTFNAPITVRSDFVNSDKPWIAVDTAIGTGQHDVYLVGQSIKVSPARLMLTVSTDGSGATWSAPNHIRTVGTNGVQSIASAIAVTGPEHKAYVVWFERRTNALNNLQNYLQSCQVLNRGTTLLGIGTNTLVTLVTTNASAGRLELKRSNSAASDDWFSAYPFPVVAANPSPTKAGHLYVAYADQAQNADPNDRADVFLVQSTNGGVNWSSPIRISSVATNDQWMPVMTVKPDGSKLFFAWYDRRNDPNNSAMDLYGRWATLDASGAVVLGTEFKITTQSAVPTFAGTRGAPCTNNGYYDPAYPPGDVDLSWWYDDWPLDAFGDPIRTVPSYIAHVGEYNGVSSDDVHIFCAWTDHRNAAQGTMIGRTQADIRFLRLRW